MQQSIWQWLVYAILGILTISLLPNQYRWLLIVILLLGGIYYIEAKKGGLGNFITTVEGNNAN